MQIPQGLSQIDSDTDGNDPLGREGGDAPRAAHVGIDGAAEADRAAGEESFWAGAKYDFMHSGMSIRRIAEKHVVTEGTLRHRIKAWGWVRVIPTQQVKPGPKLKRPEPCYGTGPNAEALHRKRIVARLFRVLDHKMRLLEERMANEVREGAAPQSAADTERDVRSFGSLMQIYAKLAALDDAARGAEQGSAAEGTRTSDDADQLRRDLALRLERLNRERDA